MKTKKQEKESEEMRIESINMKRFRVKEKTFIDGTKLYFPEVYDFNAGRYRCVFYKQRDENYSVEFNGFKSDVDAIKEIERYKKFESKTNQKVQIREVCTYFGKNASGPCSGAWFCDAQYDEK